MKDGKLTCDLSYVPDNPQIQPDIHRRSRRKNMAINGEGMVVCFLYEVVSSKGKKLRCGGKTLKP